MATSHTKAADYLDITPNHLCDFKYGATTEIVGAPFESKLSSFAAGHSSVVLISAYLHDSGVDHILPSPALSASFVSESRINHKSIKNPDFVFNSMIVVHSLFFPFVHCDEL